MRGLRWLWLGRWADTWRTNEPPNRDHRADNVRRRLAQRVATSRWTRALDAAAAALRGLGAGWQAEAVVSWDLRHGRYQDVLADVRCDVLISDPPFSPRVHAGQRTGSSTRKSTLVYDSFSEADCRQFAEFWAQRTAWWAVIFSDHTAAVWWESAWQDAGWYVFAPVIVLRECPTPRMAGDGPTSSAEYVTVARRRARLPPERVGSRPGHYIAKHTNSAGYAAQRWHPGGKSDDLMRRIIRDYSRPGDLVCDPCAGGATTLVAALQTGRRAIGAEIDPQTHSKALQRLGQTRVTVDWLDAPEAEQAKLFG